jgi:dimethylargininase
VTGCLHLKSAVTAVAEDALLVNPAWIDRGVFRGLRCITVHPSEPHAANALLVGDRVLHPAAFPLTRERLEHVGVSVHPVEADELAKAEGGLTCCSILVSVPQ